MPRRFENNTIMIQHLDSEGSSHSTVTSRGDSAKTPRSSALFAWRKQVSSPPMLVSRKQQAPATESSSAASSTTISSSASSPLPSRKVTFKRSVHVKRVDPLWAYTKDEIEAFWYTESEMNAIKQDSKRVTMKCMLSQKANRAKDDDDDNDDDLCARGLEHRTTHCATSQAQRRKVACQTVLHEQRQQKRKGVCHPEEIASGYAWECRPDQQVAYLRAREDAYAAAVAAQ
jgi:hypothetical protein